MTNNVVSIADFAKNEQIYRNNSLSNIKEGYKSPAKNNFANPNYANIENKFLTRNLKN
jgi:hypothetical protein